MTSSSLSTALSSTVIKYPVGDYHPGWIQSLLKMDERAMMNIVSELPFADRNSSDMKYRGHTLARTKFFAVDSLANVPVYRYPGFQYVQIPNYYHLITEHPFLQTIQDAIEHQFGHGTNHVIGTLYENEHDNIGWHFDKPATIDPNVPIFIISFGAQRPLLFRRNGETDACYSIPMEPGSLFILSAKINSQYEHCIPSSSTETFTPRISLIYRQICNRISIEEMTKKVEQSIKGKTARENHKKRKLEATEEATESSE
jgi:alkylated DNA repair dioxygenase AlkB